MKNARSVLLVTRASPAVEFVDCRHVVVVVDHVDNRVFVAVIGVFSHLLLITSLRWRQHFIM